MLQANANSFCSRSPLLFLNSSSQPEDFAEKKTIANFPKTQTVLISSKHLHIHYFIFISTYSSKNGSEAQNRLQRARELATRKYMDFVPHLSTLFS